jgi:Tfp pilus assembly protein PilF
MPWVKAPKLTLAQAYEVSGQPGLAQDFYLKAVKITHGEERFTAEYARFLIKTRAWKTAEKVLEDTLEPNSNDAWLLGLMAR